MITPGYDCGPLTLGGLIKALTVVDPDLRVSYGFGAPCSHRWDYSELAFVAKRDTTVGEMLAQARSALGQTFTGWKGGEYTMDELTPVNLVRSPRDVGETLGKALLMLMLQGAAVNAANGLLAQRNSSV